jgi:hypothetical protein
VRKQLRLTPVEKRFFHPDVRLRISEEIAEIHKIISDGITENRSPATGECELGRITGLAELTDY